MIAKVLGGLFGRTHTTATAEGDAAAGNSSSNSCAEHPEQRPEDGLHAESMAEDDSNKQPKKKRRTGNRTMKEQARPTYDEDSLELFPDDNYDDDVDMDVNVAGSQRKKRQRATSGKSLSEEDSDFEAHSSRSVNRTTDRRVSNRMSVSLNQHIEGPTPREKLLSKIKEILVAIDIAKVVNSEENIVELFCPLSEEKKWKCCFTDCQKDFKSQPGLLSHLENYFHDIAGYIIDSNTGQQKLSPSICSYSEFKALYNSVPDKDLPIITKDFMIRLEGLQSVKRRVRLDADVSFVSDEPNLHEMAPAPDVECESTLRTENICERFPEKEIDSIPTQQAAQSASPTGSVSPKSVSAPTPKTTSSQKKRRISYALEQKSEQYQKFKECMKKVLMKLKILNLTNDGDEHEMIFEKQDLNWKCAFPGCIKTFASGPGAKYHLERCRHNLSFLETFDWSDVMESINSLSDFKALYQSIPSDELPVKEECIVILQDKCRGRWPILFDFDEDEQDQTSDTVKESGKNSKSESEMQKDKELTPSANEFLSKVKTLFFETDNLQLIHHSKDENNDILIHFPAVKDKKKQWSCCFVNCPKILSSTTGLKYHIGENAHDCASVFGSSKDNPDVMEVLKELSALKELCPSKEQLYFRDYFFSVEGHSKSRWKLRLDMITGVVEKFKNTPKGKEPELLTYKVKMQKPPNPSKYAKKSNLRKLPIHPSPSWLVPMLEANEVPIYDRVRPRHSFIEVVMQSEEYFPKSLNAKVSSITSIEEPQYLDVPLFASEKFKGTVRKDFFVANTGGSVWGLDWVPGIEKGIQYFAAGGYKETASENHLLGVKQTSANSPDSMKGCIQIWGCGDFVSDEPLSTNSNSAPKVELCILHEHGVVYDLKWLRGNIYESLDYFKKQVNLGNTKEDDLPRLGLLAATFGDGGVRIFNVPHPQALKQKLHIPNDNIAFVKCTPLFEGIIEDTVLWRVAWGGIGRIASGCTNGNIAIWNFKSHLNDLQNGKDVSMQCQVQQPHEYFNAHDSAITSIIWQTQPVELKDGIKYDESDVPTNTIFSSGCDGRLLAHDVLDVWSQLQVQRSKAMIFALRSTTSLDGLLYIDSATSVRILSHTDDGHSYTHEMPWRKASSSLVIGHSCSILDIDISKNFPFIISCGEDGFCKLSGLIRPLDGKNRYRALQDIMYKLEYDKESNSFLYLNNLPMEMVSDFAVKNDSGAPVITLESQIQRCVFNYNKSSASWILTGATGGLVRIESTYFIHNKNS